MKKKLLIVALLLVYFLTTRAQTSCATALDLPIDATTTVGELTGTYVSNCFVNDPTELATAANWYKFTAMANGVIRINTNLDANDGVNYSDDTRISVYTGTCTSLTCLAASDDINTNNGNYLTDFFFQVTNGQTYYVAFDNNWTVEDVPTGFQVEVSFNGCYPTTGGFGFVNEPTTTTATISWTTAINSPVGYEVLYGPTGFDPDSEGTTIISLTTPQVALTNLTSGTTYDIYVRTKCSDDSFSFWFGPVNFDTMYDAATIPYSYGFESMNGGGWSILTTKAEGSPWKIGVSGDFETVQPHVGDVYAYAGAIPADSDAWLFSRKLNLIQGTTYTLSFYARKAALAGAGNVNNLKIAVGNDVTAAAQFTIQSFGDYTNEDYTLESYNFTVPATGVYYIGFNYTAPAHAQTNYGLLVIDDVTVDVSAGLNDALIAKLAVSPNPTNGVVNISNSENILINGVTVTDLNGRTVKSSKFDGTSNAQVNISDLASGMYMMTISSDNGTAVKKIIKN